MKGPGMLTIEKTYVCCARMSEEVARRYGTSSRRRARIYLLRSKGFGLAPATVYKAALYDKDFNMIASTAWSETVADRVPILLEAIGPGLKPMIGAAVFDWTRLV